MDAKDNGGNTPMHVAARLGFKKVVAKLLSLGADPLLRSANGDSSLHMAAGANCTTLMARFVDCGIDVNTKGAGGATALHVAAQTGEVSGVRMLLDEGGDVDAKTDKNWTPLRKAASAYLPGALECLLDHGKGDPRQMLQGVGTLLHSAASHGSTACMQLLVDRGLEVDSTVPSTGETVLHRAAQNGHGDAVKWLLGRGASLSVQDLAGKYPLVSATIGVGADWRARSVLEAAARSANGRRSMSCVWTGRSLLHLASVHGRPSCVEFLIKEGAEVDSTTADGDEETSMHCAARNNHRAVVTALSEASAGVDARDSAGKTALHVASANEAGLETATLLLDLGASCHIADKSGMTPLIAAAKHGHLARCSLLVARGADMAHRDFQGENALGAALVGPRSSLQNREAVMKLLVDLGCPVGKAEVDAASRGGMTGSFAKAITARMSGGTSARQLVQATTLAWSPGDAGTTIPRQSRGRVPPGVVVPAASMVAVRVSIEPAPTFGRRRRYRPWSTSEAAAPKISADESISSKVYFVDRLRLRRAVAHLEVSTPQVAAASTGRPARVNRRFFWWRGTSAGGSTQHCGSYPTSPHPAAALPPAGNALVTRRSVVRKRGRFRRNWLRGRDGVPFDRPGALPKFICTFVDDGFSLFTDAPPTNYGLRRLCCLQDSVRVLVRNEVAGLPLKV